jgi:hypothetical protein
MSTRTRRAQPGGSGDSRAEVRCGTVFTVKKHEQTATAANCIYPGPHGAGSPEHFMPESLGRFLGMAPLQGRVCKRCNNRLGDEVDLPFARTGPNGFFRWRAGVHGKRKKGKAGIASPYQVGAQGIPPLAMLGRVEGESYDILWEANFGTRQAGPLPQIIFEDATGRRIPVPLLEWMFNAPESVRAALLADGAVDPRPIAGWAAPEEQPRLDALVASLGFAVHTEWSKEKLPDQVVRLAVGAPVDDRYSRGIAKLAFHYTLAVFPELSGSEPEFDEIRRHIWDGGEPAAGLVSQLQDQVVFQLLQGRRPTHWGHIVSASRIDRVVTAEVQLFAGPEHMPLPFRIRIGRDPSQLWRLPERRAHHFVIGHPDTPVSHDGRVEDLKPIERIILPY